MRKFDSSKYFHIRKNVNLDVQDEYAHAVTMTADGLEMLARYYNEKYQCMIVLAKKGDPPAYLTVESLLEDFSSQLAAEKNRTTGEECRIGFIANVGEAHVIPIIYCEHGNKKILLIANSLGHALSADYCNEICRLNAIDSVYVTVEGRQTVTLGCRVDAMVFCKDATRKMNDGTYYIAELMKLLEKDSSTRKLGDTVFKARLPEELLKTAQTEKFVEAHAPNPDKIIHQTTANPNETLRQFRDRKSVKTLANKQRADYIREKGFKFASLIEILFYLEQIKSVLNDVNDKEIFKKFIVEAKKILKTDDSTKHEVMYNFAISFLKGLSNKNLEYVVEKLALSITSITDIKKLLYISSDWTDAQKTKILDHAATVLAQRISSMSDIKELLTITLDWNAKQKSAILDCAVEKLNNFIFSIENIKELLSISPSWTDAQKTKILDHALSLQDSSIQEVLDLWSIAAWNDEQQSKLVERVKILIKPLYDLQYVLASADDDDKRDLQFQQKKVALSISRLEKLLDLITPLLEMTALNDPDKHADILNAVTERFIELISQIKAMMDVFLPPATLSNDNELAVRAHISRFLGIRALTNEQKRSVIEVAQQSLGISIPQDPSAVLLAGVRFFASSPAPTASDAKSTSSDADTFQKK